MSARGESSLFTLFCLSLFLSPSRRCHRRAPQGPVLTEWRLLVPFLQRGEVVRLCVGKCRSEWAVPRGPLPRLYRLGRVLRAAERTYLPLSLIL